VKFKYKRINYVSFRVEKIAIHFKLYSNVFFDELFSLSLGRAGLRGRRHTHKNPHRSAELSIVGHKDKVVDLIPSPPKALM